MKNNKFVALALTPVFLIMIVFTFIPILWGFGIAFFNYNPLQAHNTFVGLANIKKLFTDSVFLISLKNTLYFVVVTVALNLVITLLIAQFISSLRSNKFRSLMRVVFFMPCVAPLAASGFVWRYMYDVKYGIINNALAVFGVLPHNWLGTPSSVIPSIIIFTLWADIGYNIIIFSTGIDGIPTDFHEAAAIDGAGRAARFFFVTLPLLARTTAFVVLMTLISQFQMFAQFEVMTRVGSGSGGPNNSGMVLTLDIYKTAFKYNDMGYASAIALALFVLIMIFTVVSRRLNRVDWGY